MDRLRKFLVTGLATGHLPLAPGTWGSAAVCAIYFFLAFAAGNGRWLCLSVGMVSLAVAASGICVALGRFAEETFGRKDPGQVTIDEWAGQAVALVAMPLGQAPTWAIVLLAFLAFRLFDIVKPPPARGIQKLPAGWGILADDLIAGVYANVVVQLLVRTNALTAGWNWLAGAAGLGS